MAKQSNDTGQAIEILMELSRNLEGAAVDEDFTGQNPYSGGDEAFIWDMMKLERGHDSGRLSFSSQATNQVSSLIFRLNEQAEANEQSLEDFCEANPEALSASLDTVLELTQGFSEVSPYEGLRASLIREDRQEIMQWQDGADPDWSRNFIASLEPSERMDRRNATMAAVGHDTHDSPAEGALALADQFISTLSHQDDPSSRAKAEVMNQAYRRFEDNYAPSSGGESLPHDPAEVRKGITQLHQTMVEMCTPEREGDDRIGNFLHDRSVTVSMAMGKRDEAGYESNRARQVSNVEAFVAPEQDDRDRILREKGLTAPIQPSGDETTTTPLATTPEGADVAAHAAYDESTGVLLIKEHESPDGLSATLQQDFPGASTQSREQNQEQELVAYIEDSLEYLEPGDAEKLAGVLSGRLEPEDIPAVEEHLRDSYGRPSDDELTMMAANAILDGHGCETVQGDHIGNGSDNGFDYVNQGDSYVPTLICHEGDFYLAGQGDVVEALEQRQDDELEGRDWSEMSFPNPNPMPDPRLQEILDSMSEGDEPTYAQSMPSLGM